MAQLHHVNEANDDFLIEWLAGASVDQLGLGVFRQLGFLEVAADFLFLDAIEHRCRELQAQQPRRPAEMRLEHLAHVHTRGHAQGVQHDVHWRPIIQERHVFFGHDLRDHAFIAVTAGHLITDRQLALGSDVNFHRLDDADIDFFAALRALNLFIVLHLEVVELLLKARDDLVDLVTDRRRIDLDAIVNAGQLAQQRLGNLAICRDDDFARLRIYDVERNLFTKQDVAQRLGQLLAQFVRLRAVLFLHLLRGFLSFGAYRLFLVRVLLLLRGDLHVHDDAVSA